MEDLPLEILQLICNYLNDLRSQLNFKSICRSTNDVRISKMKLGQGNLHLLNYHKGIKTLELNHIDWTKISSDPFFYQSHLQSLNLLRCFEVHIGSNTQLSRFNIDNCQGLRKLLINANGLHLLLCHTALKKLVIDLNFLSSYQKIDFPRYFDKLTALRELHITTLDNLPKERYDGLPCLEKLVIEGTISEKFLQSFTSLTDLEIHSEEHFPTIIDNPITLQSMTRLRRLHIASDHDINGNICEAIRYLSNLEELAIIDYSLCGRDIPIDMFVNAHKLRKLDCIGFEQCDVAHLTRLEEITFSGHVYQHIEYVCSLNTCPIPSSILSNLRVITVHGNMEIDFFDDSFAKAHKLQLIIICQEGDFYNSIDLAQWPIEVRHVYEV